MSKSAEAFRTISEVAEILDTPAHVLRFWESRFAQVKPVKRAGGRRYYRPSDVTLLSGIKHLLHDEGLTIRGVQKMLREQGVRHVAALADAALSADADDRPAAPRAAAPRWPATPSPDAASPGTDLVHDPDDVPQDDEALLAGAPPLSPDRPAHTPQAEARSLLGREIETRRIPAEATAPDGRYDRVPDAGEWIPAAAMLRAMTLQRAHANRDALRAVHDRLQTLYERRRAQGH
jgi:DNA-binding transcriptional MerR regulator